MEQVKKRFGCEGCFSLKTFKKYKICWNCLNSLKIWCILYGSNKHFNMERFLKIKKYFFLLDEIKEPNLNDKFYKLLKNQLIKSKKYNIFPLYWYCTKCKLISNNIYEFYNNYFIDCQNNKHFWKVDCRE